MRECLFIVIFAILLAGAYWLHKSGNTYVGMALVGVPFVAVCTIQPRVGLYAYCFWQSWDAAFVIGDTDSGWLTPAKMLAFLALGTGLLPLLKQNAKLLASQALMGWLFAFTLIVMFSCVWSYDPARSGRFAAQLVVQLLLLWVYVKLISVDLAYIKRLFFWTFVGGLTAATYTILFGMNQTKFGRATLSESANPGTVAASLVTAVSCVPVLWIFTRRNWFRAFLFVGSLVTVLGTFATGSRAAVGGIGIGFIAAALFSRSSAIIGRMVVVMLMCGLAFGAAWGSLHSGLLGEKSEARLAGWLGVDPPSGARSVIPRGGREEVWRTAWKGFKGTNGIGAGIGEAADANLRHAGIYKDVHSNILGSLVEMGILGFVSFAMINALLVIQSWKMNIRKLTGPAIVIFCGYFSFGATHTTYVTKLFWIPITFMIILFEFDARVRDPSMLNTR